MGGQEGQTTRNCLLFFLSAASHSSQLLGMGCFLGLNALNFAEADRPFNRLSDQQVAEMYFAMSLQCHYSMPYVSSLPMVSLQCHYSMPYVSSLPMVSLQCHYSMPYVSSLPMVSLQCHYSMPYVSSLPGKPCSFQTRFGHEAYIRVSFRPLIHN